MEPVTSLQNNKVSINRLFGEENMRSRNMREFIQNKKILQQLSVNNNPSSRNSQSLNKIQEYKDQVKQRII
jgi:hypothetical protein